MKKSLSLFLLLFAFLQQMKAQDALFIYRNDNTFNAFFFDEVDSMAYSRYDLDSLYFEDYVVQDIFTQDSVYRIPLSAIDSIGFVQPDPVFKSDVILFTEEWMPYICEVGDTSIVFHESTPFVNTIKIGSVLVSKDVIPDYAYFSGRVMRKKTEDNKIVFYCNPVEKTEIYERLISHRQIIGSNKKYSLSKKNWLTGTYFFDIPPYEPNINLEEISLHGKTEMDIRIVYTVKILPNTNEIERLKVISSINSSHDLSLNLKDVSENYRNSLPYVPIPILPGVNAFIESSFFYEPKLSFLTLGIKDISFTYSATHEIYKDALAKWRYKKVKESFTPKQPHPFIAANGEIYAGIGTKIGLGIPEVSAVGLDMKTGMFADINAEFDVNIFSGYNTVLYDALKDNRLSLGGRIEVIPYTEIVGLNTEETFPNFKLIPYNKPFKPSLYLLPKFDEFGFGYKVYDDGKLYLRSEASRQLFMPAQIGFSLYDSENNRIGETKYIDYPCGISELSFTDEGTFTIKKGEKYTCYPFVRLKFGDKYLETWRASPSMTIDSETNIKIDTNDAIKNSITSIRLSGVDYEDMDSYGFYVWKTEDAFGLDDGFKQQIPAMEHCDNLFTSLFQDMELNCEYSYYAYGIKDDVIYRGMKKKIRLGAPELSINNARKVEENKVLLSGVIENYTPGVDKIYAYFEYKLTDSNVWKSPSAQYSEDDRTFVYTINRIENGTYDYRLVCQVGYDTYYSTTKQFSYPFDPIKFVDVKAKRAGKDMVVLSGVIEGYTPIDNFYVYFEYKQTKSNVWKSPSAQYSEDDRTFVYTIKKIENGTYDYRLVCQVGYNTYYSTTKQFSYPFIPVHINNFVTTSALFRPIDHPQPFTYKGKLYEFKYNVATTVKLTDDEGVENWGYCYKGPESDSIISRISLKGAPYEYEDKRFLYYRNGNPRTHVAKLYPFVKYTGDDKYYYGEPVDYPLIYPETSEIELTGCSTPEVVTRQNVEYNGVTYDYCSTFIFDYDVTGAYWISVGADELGSGWSNWDTNLPKREQAKAADGSNRLTLNYYYNKKALEGDYMIRLKGTDNTHESGGYVSKDYVRLIHDGQVFTGCELKTK